MTIAEATTRVRIIIGESLASFFTTDDVKGALSLGETRVASNLIHKYFNIPGWKERNHDLLSPLIVHWDTDTIITTPAEYSLPADFMRHIHSKAKLDVTVTALRNSDLLDYEECMRRNQITLLAPSYNFPIHFIRGGKIIFLPYATGVFTDGIEVDYFKNVLTIAAQADFSLLSQVHIPVVYYASGFLFEKRRKIQESNKYLLLGDEELQKL